MIVLCHGCFDIFHYGHLKYLEEARAMAGSAGILIVSLTADKYFPKNKGANRPVFNEQQRAEMLMSLRIVNNVWICHDTSGVPAIMRFRPHYFVKGIDYAEKGIIEAERAACERYGAQVKFTGSKKYGSGELVEFIK